MKHLVLAGAGHAHAFVLEARAAGMLMRPRITLVSPSEHAPYSGMVPGWLAGEHDWADCTIDFAALAERAGAGFISGVVEHVDRSARSVRLRSGQVLPYDILSINVGSTVDLPQAAGMRVLPTRPLDALQAAWRALLEDARHWKAGTACRLVVVGGGAAACECILAAQRRLTALAPQVDWRFTIAAREDRVLPRGPARASCALTATLRKPAIEIRTGFAAAGVRAGTVVSVRAERLDADVLLWATGARAFAWPRASGLPVDEAGFIRVTPTLQMLDDPAVFAVGDCAAPHIPLPKAGVYSVRMGPVLAENLQAALEGRPLRAYRPQRRHLALIRTGSRDAIAAWGPLAASGRWAWSWKQRVDRAFIDRFTGRAGRPSTIFPWSR